MYKNEGGESYLMYNLEKISIKDPVEASYIPILDRTPKYAAMSLTKDDLKEAYPILSGAFEEIKQEIPLDECKYRVLVDTISSNKDNFMWYASFHKELENVLEVPTYTKLPFKKCPSARSKTKSPIFQKPFHINKSNGCYKIEYDKKSTFKSDPVNAYRVRYILEQYEITDFQDDVFPSWYLVSNTHLYEKYNERTNTRIRVSFRNGEFQYEISGASDNWQKIEDVPPEMDHVVSALIFRQYETGI